MRTWQKTLVAGAVLAVVAGGGAAFAGTSSPTALDPAAATLTATQEADLTFTREEERMALDLYTLFAEKYPATDVFSTIAASEQRHFDVVGTLLDRYDVADPAAGNDAGEYTSDAVQKLYDGWKADGLVSRAAALQVGVDLETRDIADLKALVAKDNPVDVENVYTHLLTASEHHLAAFTAVASGEDLSAVCPGGGQGRGTGMGFGPGFDRDDRAHGMGRGMGFGPGQDKGYPNGMHQGPRDGTGMGYGMGYRS